MQIFFSDFWEKLIKVSDIHFTVSNIVEILMLAVVIYFIGRWLFASNAGIIFKGLLAFMVLMYLAVFFRFNTILWIMNKFTSIGVIAILIIFQKDIRQAFEDVGRLYSLPFLSHRHDAPSVKERNIEEIVHACKTMSKDKTGALIVLRYHNSLDRFTETGISLHADISHQLLVNIFEHNTPLHDGAVIIEDRQIVAATCYLPLSDRADIDKGYGTRHRAAIGMSEETDALVIVVSEETGNVSMARLGELNTYQNLSDLKNELVNILIPKDKSNSKWKRMINHVGW